MESLSTYATLLGARSEKAWEIWQNLPFHYPPSPLTLWNSISGQTQEDMGAQANSRVPLPLGTPNRIWLAYQGRFRNQWGIIYSSVQAAPLWSPTACSFIFLDASKTHNCDTASGLFHKASSADTKCNFFFCLFLLVRV